MAGSGALGFDGKGWPWEKPLDWVGLLEPSLMTTVLKTITLQSNWTRWKDLTSFTRIRLLDGGTLNAMGLLNRGADWWCRKIGPKIDSSKAPVVGSILGEVWELVEMASMMNDFDLVADEINGSCPNIHGDLLSNTRRIIESCEKVKAVSRHPIILKVSVVHDVETIARELEGVIEAISINSVPWDIIFPGQESPLAHLGGGGVSGKIAQPFTWPMVQRLADLTPIPVIGPGVWDFEDICKLRALGAQAISFGSIFLRHPTRPTAYIRRDMSRA